MEFITNYWVILLVAFILFLLVLLSYLIDKEIRKMKDSDDTSEIKNNNDKEVYVNKLESNSKLTIDQKNDINDNEAEEIVDKSKELDYDELDIDDIDEDFNKTIQKKKLMDNTLIDSVEAMHIDDIDIDDDIIDTNIELPEIKIKKDMNEDIW